MGQFFSNSNSRLRDLSFFTRGNCCCCLFVSFPILFLDNIYNIQHVDVNVFRNQLALILFVFFSPEYQQVHYRPGFMPIIPIYGEDQDIAGSTRSVRDEGKDNTSSPFPYCLFSCVYIYIYVFFCARERKVSIESCHVCTYERVPILTARWRLCHRSKFFSFAFLSISPAHTHIAVKTKGWKILRKRGLKRDFREDFILFSPFFSCYSTHASLGIVISRLFSLATCVRYHVFLTREISGLCSYSAH